MIEWVLVYMITFCPTEECHSITVTVPISDEASCYALANNIRLPADAQAVAQCQYKRHNVDELDA